MMDKKQRRNIWWVLLITGTIIILFFFDGRIEKSDLILIKGKLKEKPIEKVYGGDVPRYNYIFKIYNSKYQFKINDCAYKVIKREEILSSNEGDSVTFYSNKINPITKNRLVYGIKLNEKEILTLTSYNSCKGRDNTYLIVILIGLNAYLIYRFVSKIKGH